jgi:hypothetical protein
VVRLFSRGRSGHASLRGAQRRGNLNPSAAKIIPFVILSGVLLAGRREGSRLVFSNLKFVSIRPLCPIRPISSVFLFIPFSPFTPSHFFCLFVILSGALLTGRREGSRFVPPSFQSPRGDYAGVVIARSPAWGRRGNLFLRFQILNFKSSVRLASLILLPCYFL